MIQTLRLTLLAILLAVQVAKAQKAKVTVAIPLSTLQDKIKGGWAGQVIGVTFGGPLEFRFQGSMINDYQPIPWYDGYIKKTMIDNPGLYDDLYMDLTFVEVFEKKGLNATAMDHAKAYAKADYMLWHANQAGRYNINSGLTPPASGHWLNNPHADDLDFQIEADFSGLMSPGMPNTAAQIGDSIGHIMNYGDGWYGGVYVGAMYSLAFVSNDIRFVVREALKMIPAKSTFAQCMSDVIKWHEQYPNDWKRNWFEIQRKWSDDTGCPDGVFHPFNIDAKINSAYILLGLLYGEGDFSKTLEISTRAGQDADCNPSSAAGILGTMLGYSRIPEMWKMGLSEAEDIDFKYTSMSLNDVYAMGYRHAVEVAKRNGGSVNGEVLTIATQVPRPVRLEQSFAGHFPVEKIAVHKEISQEHQFDFSGNGFVIRGEASPVNGSAWDYKGSFAFDAEVSIDNGKPVQFKLPVNYISRKHELFWKYQLTPGPHKVVIRILNQDPGFKVRLSDIIIYSEKPRKALRY